MSDCIEGKRMLVGVSQTVKVSVLLIALLSVACGSGQLQGLQDPFPEVSVEVREEIATETLTKNESAVLVYARGLCCPSCALGVRKTVSRLSFVDRSQPGFGVSLDPQHQLVTIALKPNEGMNTSLLWRAILDAGYDPVTIYRTGVNGLIKEQYAPSE